MADENTTAVAETKPKPNTTKPFDAVTSYNDLNARLIVAEAKIAGLQAQVGRLMEEAERHLWAVGRHTT